ncbi:MAG: hypothetical protein ACRCUY_12240 [Thermoguttaceae bacterium]
MPRRSGTNSDAEQNPPIDIGGSPNKTRQLRLAARRTKQPPNKPVDLRLNHKFSKLGCCWGGLQRTK